KPLRWRTTRSFTRKAKASQTIGKPGSEVHDRYSRLVAARGAARFRRRPHSPQGAQLRRMVRRARAWRDSGEESGFPGDRDPANRERPASQAGRCDLQDVRILVYVVARVVFAVVEVKFPLCRLSGNLSLYGWRRNSPPAFLATAED